MDILIGSSILAAFFSGIAALIAPCCIAVLLPAYFASIFKSRQLVFFMTFVFFLGVAVVYLPLGLGSAAFGVWLRQYHNTIFIFGGLFIFLLGILLLTGKHISLPFHVGLQVKKTGIPAIFVLGILSGIATTCCAPVLAGVLALSALPGSIFWGLVYTLSYVLGMVLPLFIIAFFFDKSKITQKLLQARKPITYRILSKEISLSIGELISGLMYFVIGIIITFLALSDKLFFESSYQVRVNLFIAGLLSKINGFLSSQYLWTLIAAILLAVIVTYALHQLNKKEENE